MQWNIAAVIAIAATLVHGAASALAGPGDGLSNTAHDFTRNTGVASAGSSASVGPCTFCHTPHVSKTTQLGWNHTLSKNVFDYGVAATTAGTPYARFKGDSYKGPSAKCLSCHDGSVAVGDIGDQGGQGGRLLSADKIGSNGFAVADQVGANGSLGGNHPVAMPYPYGRMANTYNGITNGTHLVSREWVSDPTANNMRLYSEDSAGNVVDTPRPGAAGIECSSCHDPHNKASKDRMFLRAKVDGSTRESGYICLQCHDKG
jgi:predicted CXXCH cytochrome family protein